MIRYNTGALLSATRPYSHYNNGTIHVICTSTAFAGDERGRSDELVRQKISQPRIDKRVRGEKRSGRK